jgi:hypothetical protein
MPARAEPPGPPEEGPAMNQNATTGRGTPSGFPEPGLYLLFPNGERVDLTRRQIEETTGRYLADPNLIPPSVKAAANYAPCAICPERHRAQICHAIMPVLPFVQRFEGYLSFDSVMAVYRESEHSPLVVAETTMQKALQYITMLSLTAYCEIGRHYDRYFRGVHPLMPQDRIAELVFANLFVHLRGDRARIQAEASLMQEQILCIMSCQIDRLRLICKSDALPNAFASTHALAQLIFFAITDHIAACERSAVDAGTAGAARGSH